MASRAGTAQHLDALIQASPMTVARSLREVGRQVFAETLHIGLIGLRALDNAGRPP